MAHIRSFVLPFVYVIVVLDGLAIAAPVTNISEIVNRAVPCRIRLQPAWVGETTNTIRSGLFTNSPTAEADKLERDLRFDWFLYTDRPWRFYTDRRLIGQSTGVDGEQTRIHAYREQFPTDAQIKAATTVSALTNILGPTQCPSDCCPRPDVWRLFRQKDDQSVETITVFSESSLNRESNEWRVEGMEIFRGTAKQEATSHQ